MARNDRAIPSPDPRRIRREAQPSPPPRPVRGSLWRMREEVYRFATERRTAHLPQPHQLPTPESQGIEWLTYSSWHLAFERTKQLWRDGVADRFAVVTPDGYQDATTLRPIKIEPTDVSRGKKTVTLPPEFQIEQMARMADQLYPDSNVFGVGVIEPAEGQPGGSIIIIIHEPSSN